MSHLNRNILIVLINYPPYQVQFVRTTKRCGNSLNKTSGRTLEAVKRKGMR